MDDHVAQGFAWSHEIVAFGVPDHDGKCLLQVELLDNFPPLDPTSLWAIRVPFDVTTSALEVGTIGFLREVKIPVGIYSLVFQALPGREVDDESYTFVFRLTFCPNSDPDFAILKQGTELSTDKVLRKDAEHG